MPCRGGWRALARSGYDEWRSARTCVCAFRRCCGVGHPVGDCAVEQVDDLPLCAKGVIVPQCYDVRREQSHQAARWVCAPQLVQRGHCAMCIAARRGNDRSIGAVSVSRLLAILHPAAGDLAPSNLEVAQHLIKGRAGRRFMRARGSVERHRFPPLQQPAFSFAALATLVSGVGSGFLGIRSRAWGSPSWRQEPPQNPLWRIVVATHQAISRGCVTHRTAAHHLIHHSASAERVRRQNY
jgi:hypothetical protein